MMNINENISGINNGFGVENANEATLEYAFNIADNPQPPIAKRGKEIIICSVDEIPIGGKRIVEIDNLSIGVYNINREFYAIKNLCPHAGAALCEGHIQTTHRPGEVGEFHPAFEGRVLRCPWHGWEFDIVTGKGLYDRNSRVAVYQTKVDEDGNVIVSL
jgi:3-phenylpropionate/trans-cinnamate dioxygenase ferredoxin subunit